MSRQTSLEATVAIMAARVAEHAGPGAPGLRLGLRASTMGVAVHHAWAGLPRLAEVDRLKCTC